MKACTRIMVHSHLCSAHSHMTDHFPVAVTFGCGDSAWPCMMLLYPRTVTAGRKGWTGKQTCSRPLSEEAEDLPTKRCYYPYYQDYSVHKRLEDIKSLVDPAPWSCVTPGPCCQQGKSLRYCRFCRLWSHPVLVIPLCRLLICPTVPYAGAIPSLWASVTTLWCSSNLTTCFWRWRVGTRVRDPTPNQDTRASESV